MSNNATSSPEAGQILAGKYLVEQVLGIGGMGVVVAAKHIQLDQKVAIKYLLPAALLNPEVVERFAREARAAAKIRGEHVARVIDVGQFDDGAPYMIMEHLEGHDLAKRLELHGPLPVEDAVRYLLETCEALAEAHSAKIVHRDLKPSNMFLATQPDKSTIIKVLDFGISKTGDAPTAALTKTSALMGTCFYMSPEQLTNPKGVDHRSDIWSLGVILYELLTGRPPFLGESIPEIIGAILSNQPEPLAAKRTDLPAGLDAVIAKCMQMKPAERLQSVAALAAALGPFANVRDRKSVEVTARVLGESLAPKALPSGNTNSGQATLLVPSSASPQTGPVQTAAQTGPTLPPITSSPEASLPSTTDGRSSNVPGVPAVTTHALASSSITEKPKRSPTPMIAGGAVVLLALVGGGIFAMKGKGGDSGAQPSAASTGLVATQPAATQPVALPTTTSTTTILPATTAAASAPDPAPVAQGAQGTAAAAPRVIPTARASAAAVASAAPVKSATPAAPAAPSATQAAAPAASTKSNPLQMGIK